MSTFHEVKVWVEGSVVEVEVEGLELTVEERNAFIRFWLDGVGA